MDQPTRFLRPSYEWSFRASLGWLSRIGENDPRDDVGQVEKRLIDAEPSMNGLNIGNYEQKRWGLFCIGRLKKRTQRAFVGLVFWPLQALTGLTHELSALDPSGLSPYSVN
jgi:hypothetical protein